MTIDWSKVADDTDQYETLVNAIINSGDQYAALMYLLQRSTEATVKFLREDFKVENDM